jgi:hypothetical protein
MYETAENLALPTRNWNELIAPEIDEDAADA